MTTALDKGASQSAEARDPFRDRLLEGLATSIDERGYRATTVADIVRQARTSKRTFYDHFASKEECFIEVLRADMQAMIAGIRAAADPEAPPQDQIRTAVDAYINHIDSYRAITLSRIREAPGLGDVARRLHRLAMEQFSDMLVDLSSSPGFQRAGLGPVDEQLGLILLGGLQELTASYVEDGRDVRGIFDPAVAAATALLGAAQRQLAQNQARGLLQSLSDFRVRRVAHARAHEGAGVEHLQRVDDVGIDVGPERRGQPIADVTPDAQSQHLDVGVLAQQRVGHRARELGLVGDQQSDVPEHLDDARCRVAGFMRRGRGGDEPAPEHLGDQMLLGREVGVGGRRPDTGLGGHAAHGQTGETLSAQELDRGPAQTIDGVGLLGGQTAPSRLQGRVGHMSGRYYNCH